MGRYRPLSMICIVFLLCPPSCKTHQSLLRMKIEVLSISGDTFQLLNAEAQGSQTCSGINKDDWCGERNAEFKWFNKKIHCSCQCKYSFKTYVDSNCTADKQIREYLGGCQQYFRWQSTDPPPLQVFDLSQKGNKEIIADCNMSSVEIYNRSIGQWIRIVNNSAEYIFEIKAKKAQLHWSKDNAGFYNGHIVKIGCEHNCFLFKAQGILQYNVTIPTSFSSTITLLPTSASHGSVLQSHCHSTASSLWSTSMSMHTPSLSTHPSTPSTASSLWSTSMPTPSLSTHPSPAMSTEPVTQTPTSTSAKLPLHSVKIWSTQQPPTGRPDGQDGDNVTAPVTVAVVAAAVVTTLIVAAVIVCHRRRSKSSAQKPKNKAAFMGGDNPVYKHSRADEMALSGPYQPARGNSHALPSRDETLDYDYDYANVDGLPSKRLSSPVYQELDRPDGTQDYESLEQPKDSTDHPVYNTLEDPDSSPQYRGLKGPIPNNEYKSLKKPVNTMTGAINEPVYNTLEEPDNPNQYYAPKGSTENHVYKSLEPKTPHTEMVNEPVYNTLGESDRDYDNVYDEEDQDPAPGDVYEPVVDAFPSESHPEYARLEGPHTIRDTPKQDQAPDYDVLERPYPIKEHVCQAGKKRRGK
ncbi:uncharacterized protein LOC5512305 isoform X3 [Nematostella vectensis]|uniref:uncharacterized protein LOC5512305 isoform X3 n=1 Tax=Nematostella vectensis TaxID=45351 RepID=UPI0020772043|nr:uncharacterized protein LOC5512305 isoform X3 [Nematostella vectensis]